MNHEHLDPEEYARLTSDTRHVPAEIEEEEPRFELTPFAEAYLLSLRDDAA